MEMLTKTLKFDEDVLGVIKAMKWSDDGLSGELVGQLDRKLYEKVNKALDVMGGKWNRKAKAHIFTFDPRPQVEGLLESGGLTVERDGFFETPLNIVAKMLELARLDNGSKVLEPSAGMGRIAVELKKNGANVFCVEKNENRAKHLDELGFMCFNKDFLSMSTNTFNNFDAVVMNPPFEEGQDAQHVMYAYEFLREGGMLVSVMGEGVFFRNDKKSEAFREWLDVVGGETIELPEGSFKESGTGVNTRLVVIER